MIPGKVVEKRKLERYILRKFIIYYLFIIFYKIY